MTLTGNEILSERRANKYLNIVNVMKNYILNDRDDRQAMERIINIMLE